MTQEEIAIKLTEHHKEIGSLKHRVGSLEDKTDAIQELVVSVKELSITMKSMLTEQEKQGKRIENLESVPSNRWNTLVTVVITALVSGFITYLLTTLL